MRTTGNLSLINCFVPGQVIFCTSGVQGCSSQTSADKTSHHPIYQPISNLPLISEVLEGPLWKGLGLGLGLETPTIVVPMIEMIFFFLPFLKARYEIICFSGFFISTGLTLPFSQISSLLTLYQVIPNLTPPQRERPISSHLQAQSENTEPHLHLNFLSKGWQTLVLKP